MADLFVRDRTAFKSDRRFNFVSFFKELTSIAKFRIEIMVIDRRAQANLFQIDDLLIFTGFFLFLLLFELKLSVVHDTGNGWFCSWSNENKIKIDAFCDFKGFVLGFDSKLFTILIDQTHFTGTNRFV